MRQITWIHHILALFIGKDVEVIFGERRQKEEDTKYTPYQNLGEQACPSSMSNESTLVAMLWFFIYIDTIYFLNLGNIEVPWSVLVTIRIEGICC